MSRLGTEEALLVHRLMSGPPTATRVNPQLVTFNGTSFDLPVLRYRAMTHAVAAPGLAARPYFNRYTDDTIDLCDVLSSFSSLAKATLHEVCRVMGLPGKPAGISGAEVEKYFRDGHIREIADYCKSDVINTYRIWLRYELFRGKLTDAAFQASESNLAEFIKARDNTEGYTWAGRSKPKAHCGRARPGEGQTRA